MSKLKGNDLGTSNSLKLIQDIEDIKVNIATEQSQLRNTPKNFLKYGKIARTIVFCMEVSILGKIFLNNMELNFCTPISKIKSDIFDKTSSNFLYTM